MSRTLERTLRGSELQLRSDLDRLVQGAVHGTELRKHPVHPLRCRPLLRGCLELQPETDSSNDEHLVFGLLDFTDRVTDEAVAISPDVARLQRAAKGSRQSAGCSRDNVVERRSVRLESRGVHLIVLSHCAVDAKDDGLRLPREVGAPDRALYALNPDLRTVHDSGHGPHLPERHPRRSVVRALISAVSGRWMRHLLEMSRANPSLPQGR